MRNLITAASAAALLLSAVPAKAGEPTKPGDSVVAAGAGGASDQMARMIQAAIQEARASGKLPAVPLGTATYSRLGKSEAESRVTWRILLPGATAASTGLPDKKGAQGDPWLQLAGTPNAHIHIK